MEIKVYGPGCAKCVAVEKLVREVVSQKAPGVTVEKVSDIPSLQAAFPAGKKLRTGSNNASAVASAEATPQTSPSHVPEPLIEPKLENRIGNDKPTVILNGHQVFCDQGLFYTCNGSRIAKPIAF